jgi:hypothetical protein
MTFEEFHRRHHVSELRLPYVEDKNLRDELAYQRHAYRNHLALKKHLHHYGSARTVVHRHSTNNHMPLLAYEVAEMEQPINWVIEIISVLLAAILAGLTVFVLGF